MWGGVHGVWVSADVVLEKDIIECHMVRELVPLKLPMAEMVASE
jgi:hypothetical protein